MFCVEYAVIAITPRLELLCRSNSRSVKNLFVFNWTD